jgi:hypothetical protein
LVNIITLGFPGMPGRDGLAGIKGDEGKLLKKLKHERKIYLFCKLKETKGLLVLMVHLE